MTEAHHSPARLAVFDIDGTLTRTNEVDNDCFQAAHGALLGETAVADNWGGFSHMTDSCISRELFERTKGRAPLASETQTIQYDFIARLQSAHAAAAMRFAPVSGAATAMVRLREATGWDVALASGGWGISARLKLGLAGIDADTMPGAFGDEFFSREEILSTAINRAGKDYGVKAFDRIVSIGDARWDVTTARNLGLPFVGVSTDNDSEFSRSVGAANIIADYTDFDALLELLERAEAP